MADKFGLSRPQGRVGRAIEDDIFVIGGVKTVSDAKDLIIGTFGLGSNLQLSVDSSGSGGFFGTVGGGGIHLDTLGELELTALDTTRVQMTANSSDTKWLVLMAQNNGSGNAQLGLYGDDRAQIGTAGSQDNITADFVRGVSIKSPNAVHVGQHPDDVGFSAGPIYIGTIGDSHNISIGNLNAVTPVTLYAGTGGLELKSTQDIAFDARGCMSPLTYNQAGALDLDPSYTATSIVGAFNEIKSSITTTIETLVEVGGTITVDSIPTNTSGGAEWFYTLYSGSNARSGKIGCAWESGTPSVKYWEFGTTDLGDTGDIGIQVVHTGTHIELQLINSGAATWTFKATRSIAGVGIVGPAAGGWEGVEFQVIGSGMLESFEPSVDGMSLYHLVISDSGGNVSQRTLSMAWSVAGGVVEYAVSALPDIGDTSPVLLDVDYTGGVLSLNVTVLSGSWSIVGTKYIRSV